MSNGFLEILDPTAKANVVEVDMAPRVAGLNGLRIGFLDNSKPNISFFEDRLEQLLRERFSLAEVIRRSKPTATRGVPLDVLEELATSTDLVINGIGD